ncbi:MAG: hypothetical protein H7178_04205 [Chitinophagaceae bacterium]|nr:hypothetical protein [Chitinophagaceae bacterium]
MENKYTILKYFCSGFFLLFILLMLKPKRNIEPLLFNPKNIDSIQISHGDTITTINKTDDLRSVCKQLEKCREITVSDTKINTGFIDLNIFINTQKKKGISN